MHKENEVFYCYDRGLHEHIKSHGISYLAKARALNTDKIFTLYKHSEQLNKVIKSYKKGYSNYESK